MPIKTSGRVAMFVALFAVLALGCDEKKDPASTKPGESPAATSKSEAPAAATAAAAGGNAKCKQAAEFKAKLKDPSVDPSTLGSVEFDKQDCESGKWSPGKADCILAAKDYETAKKCP